MSNTQIMIDEFNKDRQREKETYAIIHYFELFEKAYVVNDYTNKRNSFTLIGGEESLQRLEIDCKEGNINIFSSTILDFLETLENNLPYLEKGNQSTSVKEAIKKSKIILDEFDKDVIDSVSNAYSELISNFPFLHDELCQLKEMEPIQKKIGER